jgi:antirestriction protein ArdC
MVTEIEAPGRALPARAPAPEEEITARPTPSETGAAVDGQKKARARKRGRSARAKSARRKGSAAKESKSAARMREARESFGRALEQLRSEERFRAWLEAQRRLHRYSPRNILWILYQNPQATHVASYKRWRDELGYQVRGGEASIKVWVPSSRKVIETDPETGEEVEERRRVFRVGPVFDRSQVDPIPGEAKPLSAPPPAAVTGDSHAWAIAGLEAYAAELGFEVKSLALPEGKGGFCNYAEGLIGLNEAFSANAQVRVLAHEDAHALGIDYETFGRRRAEAIVDCAAHIVCARIGLDVSAATVPYVAGWAKEDSAVIVRDANEIDRVARAILRGAGLEERLDRSQDGVPAAN